MFVLEKGSPRGSCPTEGARQRLGAQHQGPTACALWSWHCPSLAEEQGQLVLPPSWTPRLWAHQGKATAACGGAERGLSQRRPDASAHSSPTRATHTPRQEGKLRGATTPGGALGGACRGPTPQLAQDGLSLHSTPGTSLQGPAHFSPPPAALPNQRFCAEHTQRALDFNAQGRSELRQTPPPVPAPAHRRLRSPRPLDPPTPPRVAGGPWARSPLWGCPGWLLGPAAPSRACYRGRTTVFASQWQTFGAVLSFVVLIFPALLKHDGQRQCDSVVRCGALRWDTLCNRTAVLGLHALQRAWLPSGEPSCLPNLKCKLGLAGTAEACGGEPRTSPVLPGPRDLVSVSHTTAGPVASLLISASVREATWSCLSTWRVSRDMMSSGPPMWLQTAGSPSLSG